MEQKHHIHMFVLQKGLGILLGTNTFVNAIMVVTVTCVFKFLIHIIFIYKFSDHTCQIFIRQHEKVNTICPKYHFL